MDWNKTFLEPYLEYDICRKAVFLETLQAAIIFEKFPQILRKWLVL